MSFKDFLVPDPNWAGTVWSRIDQGRRELAATIRKDVTVEKLAELINRAGPSLTAWKNGESRPKRDSLEALERLFVSAGLTLYTARFLDYGPDKGQFFETEQVADQVEAGRKVTRKRKRVGG